MGAWTSAIRQLSELLGDSPGAQAYIGSAAFSGATAGLVAGETVQFSYPLVSGHAYQIAWMAMAIGPAGATPDVAVWNAMGTSQTVLAYQQNGTFTDVIAGISATFRNSGTGSVAAWTMVPSFTGTGSNQFVTWTFTDVGSTEIVNVGLTVYVAKTPIP